MNVNTYFDSYGYFKNRKFRQIFSFLKYSLLMTVCRKPIALLIFTDDCLKAMDFLKMFIKTLYFKNICKIFKF